MATSHCLNQWWHIASCIGDNKFQWNCDQNKKIVIEKNVKMSSAKCPPFCWSLNVFNHLVPKPVYINSLASERSECDSKNVIFNLVSLIGIFRSSHDNALRWMPWDLTDDKSTLVQVMAWCRQATSLYLSQYWLSSMSPYDVARPQWVKVTRSITVLAADDLPPCYRQCRICVSNFVTCNDRR